MKIVSLDDAPGYADSGFVAEEILAGSQENVRIIRLKAGQAVPPHTHGVTDVMLFAAEGTATIQGPDGPLSLPAGSIAHIPGDEELVMSNEGDEPVTLLAFLAPPFPPR